jgi:GT2 family glycosyltransferase
MSSVLIAIPTSGRVTAKLVNWLMQFSRFNHQVEIFVSEMRPIEANRRRIRKVFLEKEFDYLIQIDDDILPPIDLLKIIDNNKPICSAGVKTIKEIGIISLALKETAENEYLPLTPTGLTECDAVGGGCVCIHRSVLEKVDYSFMNENIRAEDFYFCKQAKQNGFTVWYDATIPVQHFTIVPL